MLTLNKSQRERIKRLGPQLRGRWTILDGSPESIEDCRTILRFEMSLSGERIGQVAKRAGVCWSSLAGFWRGKTHSPHAKTLARMLTAVGYTVYVGRD